MVFPTASADVTVKLRAPAVEVSSAEPVGALPVHETTSAGPSSSVQANDTFIPVPTTKLEPSCGTAIEISGADPSPVYATGDDAELPPVSAAVAVNDFAPPVAVSIGAPDAAVPVHEIESLAASGSAHVYEALITLP